MRISSEEAVPIILKWIAGGCVPTNPSMYIGKKFDLEDFAKRAIKRLSDISAPDRTHHVRTCKCPTCKLLTEWKVYQQTK